MSVKRPEDLSITHVRDATRHCIASRSVAWNGLESGIKFDRTTVQKKFLALRQLPLTAGKNVAALYTASVCVCVSKWTTFSQKWLCYVWLMAWQIRLSVCRLWRACTLLRGFNFSGIFLHHIVAWPSGNSPTKNHEDRSRGSPPTGALNAREEECALGPGPLRGSLSPFILRPLSRRG